MSASASPLLAEQRVPFFSLFPALMLPMFLAIVDQTIVAAALPSIGRALGNVSGLSWVIVAYLTAATISAPLFGLLGDTFGRRHLLLLALVIITVGSFACALSTSIPMLIAARIMQGFGGGGLMTLSQALIGENVEPRQRGRYQGYIAGIAMVANTSGPVIGGLLAGQFGWQSVFWFNPPFALLAGILVWRLPTTRQRPENFRFDYLGLLLFAVFVASTFATLEQVQRPYQLSVVAFGIPLLVAALSLPLLIRHEQRAPIPLLPLSMLRNPAIWRADLLAACHGATLVALITVVPIYLTVVHGASASEVGLLMLPMTAGIGIGSMITGRTVSRTGHTALLPSIGLVFVILCLGYLAWRGHELSTLQTSLALGVTACFMGTVMAVVQITVQSAAGPGKLGLAAASVQYSRSLGAAFGTAIVSTVLFLGLSLSGSGVEELFSSLVREGPGSAAAISPAARQTISTAFGAAFFTMTGFAVVGLLLAWSLPLRRV